MKLAKIFSDNMVFQANKPIYIFGEGKGKITLDFLGKKYESFSQNEQWVIKLDAVDYGGPYEICILLNDKNIVLKNVMIGDVLLCAGQSNMQFQIDEQVDADKIIGNENVRYYVQDRLEQHGSLHSDEGWLIGKTENIGRFSALGFHVGDKLNKMKNHAIGIVGCFQGASVIRSWMNAEDLTEDIFIPISDRHPDTSCAFWNGDSELYTYTFLPIAPFGFNSIIWYQGESNTSLIESKVYVQELKRLIFRWRKDLEQKELPFIVVQICDYDCNQGLGWKAIQQAQVDAVNDVENSFLVTSSDVCEHKHIHPNDKRKLAIKIAKLL